LELQIENHEKTQAPKSRHEKGLEWWEYINWDTVPYQKWPDEVKKFIKDS
jgi:hypothetical protein